MTPDEQRVAIAEWCGWKRHIDRYKDGSVIGENWVRPDGVGMPLPDFPNDLNAIHEAEKLLKDSQIKQYVANIWRAMHLSPQASIGTIHATAAQRCEALFWLAAKIYKVRQGEQLEETIAKDTKSENLRFEIKNAEGKWEEVDASYFDGPAAKGE